MEVWHVLFPCYVQCVHAFVARSAQLFDLTISTTKRSKGIEVNLAFYATRREILIFYLTPASPPPAGPMAMRTISVRFTLPLRADDRNIKG